MMNRTSRIATLLVFMLLWVSSAAFGQVSNEIVVVEPGYAVQGETVVVRFTLDSDMPPAPPVGIVPDSIKIGGLNGHDLIHESDLAVEGRFIVPAELEAGWYDVAIYFSTPDGNVLAFRLDEGFEVKSSGNFESVWGDYPIVDTGQVGCYDAWGEMSECPEEGEVFYGQDGQVVGDGPLYQLGADGKTVDDLVTGLTWTRSADLNGDGVINVDDKLTLSGARGYVPVLNDAEFGGYDDWRLPTIKELYSLMHFEGLDPSVSMGGDTSGLVPFIDTAYFEFGYGDSDAGERIIDAQFATETEYGGLVFESQSAMFGLNLADGRIKGYPSEGKLFYVYYVRGNEGYGVNRYVDNGDGTVMDQATGMMWMKVDSGEGMTWGEALAWAVAMNDTEAHGYSDWRVPNAKELQSLVDYTRCPDVTGTAAIDPVFETTGMVNEAGQDDFGCYWSSTTHLSEGEVSAGNGVYVAFGRAMGYMDGQWQDVHGAGAQRSDPKEGDPGEWSTGHGPQGDAIRIYNFVRLVRDGQCGEPGYYSGLGGDLDGDCVVGLEDYAVLMRKWEIAYSMDDLLEMAENWLSSVDNK